MCRNYCYVKLFYDSVISFKSFYIRRILYQIWQFIPKFTTRISKTNSVYLFVDSRKIKIHWKRFPGVETMDIKDAYQCDPKDSAVQFHK